MEERKEMIDVLFSMVGNGISIRETTKQKESRVAKERSEARNKLINELIKDLNKNSNE